jgi:hypothetical protein
MYNRYLRIRTTSLDKLHRGSPVDSRERITNFNDNRIGDENLLCLLNTRERRDCGGMVLISVVQKALDVHGVE